MAVPTDVKQAINDRFISLWNNQTPYTFDNEEFTAIIGESWVRVTIKHKSGNQTSLGKKGNRKYERRGLIFVSVFIPVEIGTSKADLLAKTAQDIFEGERFNEVVVTDSTIREIGAENGWYQIIMQADFIYYEVK